MELLPLNPHDYVSYLEIFKKYGGYFSTGLVTLVATLSLWKAYKNRSRLLIHSLDYHSDQLLINMENIGAEPNSIKSIKVKGLTASERKNKTEYLKIASSSLLKPCNTTAISAVPETRIDLWFIVIKIILTKSRSKKIRMRYVGNLEDSNLNIIQYYFEKFFFKYFPRIYHKYIHIYPSSRD